MSKNKKIIAVLLLAIVFAVLAGMAIVSFLSPHRTTIYVFKNAYTIGTQLTSDMLLPVQVDTTIVNAGKTSTVSDRFVTANNIRAVLESGDTLKVSVTDGMPLMPSLLSVSGGNSILMTMSPDAVAVSVSVDNVTGVTQNLYSGASVNVYVTSYSGGTFLLFENMRILEVNRRSSGELSSVTLEVNNEEAVKLINSIKNGSIQFGLINPTGYQYESGTSEILVNPDVETKSDDDEVTYTDTTESTGDIVAPVTE